MFTIISLTLQILLWSVVILTPLVVIHEFGHLLIARLFGVKIPEFGIGLPLSKSLISRRYKGINWSLYPWLLGGFVRIYGDHDVLDDIHELYKSDPIEAKKQYPEARMQELLAQQTIQDILHDNFLECDDSWKWFSAIPYMPLNEMDDIQSKAQLRALSVFKAHATYPPFIEKLSSNGVNISELCKKTQSYIRSCSPEIKQVITQSLQDEYYRLRSLLLTLAEWEFDAKIGAKNAQNKKSMKEAFFAKNIVQKLLIISGGVLFNFVTAWILLIISFGFIGTMPETITAERNSVLQNQISAYEQDTQVIMKSKGLVVYPSDSSPLKEGGMVGGDQIIRIQDRDVFEDRFNSREDIASFLNQYSETPITLSYYRPSTNEYKDITVTLSRDEATNNVMLQAGVGYTIQRKSYSFLRSFGDSYNETVRIAGATFQGLGDIIRALLPQTSDKSALQSVTGPIGVGYASGILFSESGLVAIVYLIAVISIALAVFNMLPIPALDGGRAILLIVGAIMQKRHKKIESWAISVTFMLLLLLAILVAGQDIMRIIGR